MAKAMTLRLNEELAADLATVAAVDGKPVADVVREAIMMHLRTRRGDPAFAQAVRDHIAKAQRLLGGHTA